MALPWVRLDTNIATHDKVLDLLADPSPKRWQAMTSYMFSIAWSGGHATDGRVPRSALPVIQGTAATASLLCKYRLWEARTADWLIVNYGDRQLSAGVSDQRMDDKRRASAKGNCSRWHGDKCWQNGACSREP